MAKRKSKPEPKPTRYEFETFLPFGFYHMHSLEQKDPSAFNGFVRVRKWRIVAELVDEPVAVIAERIRKLWRECDNMHHHNPLLSAAAEIGIELDSKELSVDREKRTKRT